MRKKTFNGLMLSGTGSLWWGVIGVIYFKSVYFVSPLELTIHRLVWTAVLLALTISFQSKWEKVFIILKKKKTLILLFICGILIVGNWFTWIYAVTINKLVDASFGYFIFPILSVFFGMIFLKEEVNKMKLVSIFLVFTSIVFLLLNFKSTPWIGLIVAITWSLYTLIRKKINVPTDLGLFIESIFITPFALMAFYFIYKEGNNFFGINDIKLSLWLFLAGVMTLVPLYLYLKGSELAGLGSAGMIFFLAPTGQFVLGIFYFGEFLDINKLISFIIIWVAIIIYLLDLKKNEI
jgi:chloramphenicol-sensitive protein RarD